MLEDLPHDVRARTLDAVRNGTGEIVTSRPRMNKALFAEALAQVHATRERAIVRMSAGNRPWNASGNVRRRVPRREPTGLRAPFETKRTT